MKPKVFARFLARDNGRCYHCGTTEGLVPQHRRGGMGGGRDQSPQNIITFCGIHNGEIESDPVKAEEARAFGWKLSNWQSPADFPVYDRYSQRWYYLTPDYKRHEK